MRVSFALFALALTAFVAKSGAENKVAIKAIVQAAAPAAPVAPVTTAAPVAGNEANSECPVFLSFNGTLHGRGFENEQFDAKRPIPAPIAFGHTAQSSSIWLYELAGLRIPSHAVHLGNQSTICLFTSDYSEFLDFQKILSSTDGAFSIEALFDLQTQTEKFQIKFGIGQTAISRSFQSTTGGNAVNYFQQFCMTYDGKEVNFYIDKALKDTLQLSELDFAPYSKSGFILGGGSFNGYVGEVLICNAALSQAQIIEHYNGWSR